MNEAATAALRVLRASADTFAHTAPRDRPLVSIFSELYRSGEQPPAPGYVAARALQIVPDTLFPTLDPRAAQARTEPDLADRFRAVYAALGADSDRTLDQLFYLLHEYGWAVPSQGDAAVSLFDQARTEAALAAACVSDPQQVVLLGGDVSGVQSFLYTLPAAGATRALRGRSFYLQMLTEAVARYLLRQLELPITNLLYSGGGRFYLVLPASALAEVDRWRRELGLLLLRRHNGELYIALGAILTDTTLLHDPEHFRDSWRSLNEAVNEDKRRKFATLAPDLLLNTLFAPQGHGGDVKAACVVCRYQGEPGEFEPFAADREAGLPNDQQRTICHLCRSFDDVARDLHNAAYLVLSPVRPTMPERRARAEAYQVLRDLGLDITITRNISTLQFPAASPGPIHILGLNGPIAPALRQGLAHPAAVFGIRPLVNETPRIRQQDVDDSQLQEWWSRMPDEQRSKKVGDVKTFGVLVQQSAGIKRLGVLRMDVDDLGDLFQQSLRNPSLARIGSLSAALVRFFEGWVGELCRQANQRHGDRIYAIYSGGDDLFIVGSWHVLPELARAIHDDFVAYALNERVHVSAGISLHGQKFPLYQAAHAAQEELDRAKALDGKNAFGFLEQAVRWGPTAADVFTLYTAFTTYLSRQHGEETAPQRERLSRSVLQILQELYSQYIQMPNQRSRTGETTQLFFGPWIWRGVYQLTRMAESRRKDADVFTFLTTIRDRLTENHQAPARAGERFIERVGLAARWAELSLRKEQP